jgi:hypothetical protein
VRFDGSTRLLEPGAGGIGDFECDHPECAGVFASADQVAKALARVARAEGL